MCPIILEKLPNELRLIISTINNENNWNFTKILDLIKAELKDREAYVVPSHSATDGKNDFGFCIPSHTPYIGSSLVSDSSSVNREKKKFKKGGSKCHLLEGSGRKCVFWDAWRPLVGQM